MIAFDNVCSYYPFEPPVYFSQLAVTFSPNPFGSFLSDAELSAVEETTGMDGACFTFLREMNDALLADPARNLAAHFLRYVLFEARYPWENYIYAPILFEIPGYQTASVDLLFVTAALGYTLTVRKPPADLNRVNINSYCNDTKSFMDSNGYWGIGARNWSLLHAGGCMFRFHTLMFQPARFSKDFLVLTDGKQYRTLLKGEFHIAADGSLAASSEHAAFRTSCCITKDAFLAHEILPNGTVQETCSAFSKTTWSVALCDLDMVLEFHIPPESEYTPKQHRISMMQALDFYRSFYPQMTFKAFACYSWLYSAQNKYLFPEDSRILEIERCVHLCPICATLDENLMFIRKGSALQERIASFRAAGNEYHIGYMYSPISEAQQFGTYRHKL